MVKELYNKNMAQIKFENTLLGLICSMRQVQAR